MIKNVKITDRHTLDILCREAQRRGHSPTRVASAMIAERELIERERQAGTSVSTDGTITSRAAG
jgi:hypothetical protein